MSLGWAQKCACTYVLPHVVGPSKAAQPKCTDIEILINVLFFLLFAHYSAESFKTTLDSWKCNPAQLYRKNRIAVKRVGVRLGPSSHFALTLWPISRVRVWVRQLRKTALQWRYIYRSIPALQTLYTSTERLLYFGPTTCSGANVYGVVGQTYVQRGVKAYYM